MGRQIILPKELLACRGLKGSKAEYPIFILPDYVVDDAVAEVANSIE